MDGQEFVSKLKEENEAILARIDEAPPSSGLPKSELLAVLVKMALKNEIEAAEIAAEWVCTTPELPAKLALARHAGDEARHYQLIEEKAHAMGISLDGFRPLDPPSPVLTYLRTLTTTPDRIAAALVAREAMGGRRNVQFLAFLDRVGQRELAALYREVINPDEDRHHLSGCSVLAGLAASPETQQAARRAALGLPRDRRSRPFESARSYWRPGHPRLLNLQFSLLSCQGHLAHDQLMTVAEQILLQQGDLTEMDADAIVNAANNDLKLGGGLAGVIRRKAGDAIQRECNEIGTIPVGGAAITSGGKLKARHIIHAATMQLGGLTTGNALRASTAHSLRIAAENGLQTIAFPAIGTGIGGFPLSECAAIMLHEVAEHLKRPTSLQRIYFVLFDKTALSAFEKVLREMTERGDFETGGSGKSR